LSSMGPPAFHPAAAADSWQRVMAFFAEHVRRSH
jgi:hypothetical protein